MATGGEVPPLLGINESSFEIPDTGWGDAWEVGGSVSVVPEVSVASVLALGIKESSFKIPESACGGWGDEVVAEASTSVVDFDPVIVLNNELMAFFTPAMPCSTALSSLTSGLASMLLLSPVCTIAASVGSAGSFLLIGLGIDS